MSESSTQQGGSFKYAVLIILLVLSIVSIGVIFVLLERKDRLNSEYTQLTIEQQLLSRSMVTQALEASRGGMETFEKLKATRDRFDTILNIQKGQGSLSEVPSEVLSSLQDLEGKWQQVRSRVDTILAGQEAVLSVRNFVPLLEGLIPRLVDLSDQIATSLTAGSASAKQVYVVTRQLLLGQRMESNLSRMLTGGAGAATAADDFERDVARFGAVLKGMATGDARLGVEPIPGVGAKLTELSNLFGSMEKQAGVIRGNSPALFQLQSATQAIVGQGDGLLQASSELLAQYKAAATKGVSLLGLTVDERYAYGLGLLALCLVLWLAWEANRNVKLRLLESEQRKQETEEQNRRNQDAILRLLDELGDLAEGDLTVQASVTEDITGAIADSVNYAIEALRDLVSTINNTSELVASAAQETRGVADRLARASEVQARQIESSSKTVIQMAQFMDEVSVKTAASAEVAEKSVSIAHEGGDRVRYTIQGMDAIREHIQETSKRIKRLGESSQEIGDIVALINDIADQTNILALNAAIQASAAGEAGRGFAVVADEVQRLAERASNSTKRIETLVKTIQADTNEAIISMEKSTTEVVNGADLAEKAGEALEEIETVSARLAALINDISKAAAQVTEMASRVSTAMISINEITAQTSESSLATASSIGKLNQLAQELRQSVTGFRLPEQSLSNS